MLFIIRDLFMMLVLSFSKSVFRLTFLGAADGNNAVLAAQCGAHSVRGMF